jgi:hypothetical protein
VNSKLEVAAIAARQAAEAAAQKAADEAPAALFAGDSGALRLETRRVIVQLLLGPSLDARRQTRLWPVLVRDEAVVRSRLNELFLELVIDREQEVAFTRQIASAELEMPVLLRRTPLTLLDSALLLFLRQRLTEAQAQQERAVVSAQEMTEHLAVFQRDASTDHARFARQVQHAVDNASKYSLLRKLRNADDRFEISPTLKLLFSAEEIVALLASYRAEALRGGAVGDGDDDGDASADTDADADGDPGAGR